MVSTLGEDGLAARLGRQSKRPVLAFRVAGKTGVTDRAVFRASVERNVRGLFHDTFAHGPRVLIRDEAHGQRISGAGLVVTAIDLDLALLIGAPELVPT